MQIIFYSNIYSKKHEMINWNKNLYFFAKNVSFLNYAFKVKMWVGFGFYEVGWTFVRPNCLLSQFQVAGLSKFTKLNSLSKMAFRKILLPFGFDRNLIERLKFKIVEVSGKNTSSEQGRQNDFLHRKVPKLRK